MRSIRTREFRRLLAALPVEARRQASHAYQQFQDDPYHESLHFKRASGYDDVYSARVGIRYRVLGIRDGDVLVWYWIGTHADYDRLLRGR
ncbi:MAG: hypothetical protein IH609_18435 [Dehalococcoidia bacterium]|nr:hypothetical protein [Dehalococcoidia bacterium]